MPGHTAAVPPRQRGHTNPRSSSRTPAPLLRVKLQQYYHKYKGAEFYFYSGKKNQLLQVDEKFGYQQLQSRVCHPVNILTGVSCALPEAGDGCRWHVQHSAKM